MAFTIPGASFITELEATTEYARLAGGSVPTATATLESIRAGVFQAYHEIIRCLRARGYFMADIALWGLAEGKSVQLYLSVYYWGRDGTVRTDAEWWDIVQTYRERWDDVCKGGAIFDASGNVLTPDTSSAATAQQQAEGVVRNGTAGSLHDFWFDANPRQFMGNNAHDIAAGTTYGNSRLGT